MSEEMVRERRKYEKYASTIRVLLLVAGLWPGPGLPRFSNYVVFLYSSSFIVVIFASINFIVHNLTNVSGVIQAMGISISFISVVMKVTVFTLNRVNMKRMHEILESSFRKEFSRSELEKVLLSPLNYFYKPTVMMARIFLVLPFAFIFRPLVSILAQLVRGTNPIQYELLFCATYPWNPKTNAVTYVLHYLLESFSAIATAFVSLSVDVGLGYWVFHITGQFRVLGYRLIILDSSNDYRRLIRECVLRRRILTECCECLERAYGPVVLWLMVTNALSLCANIYQLTKMSTGSIAQSVLYIMAKLLQSLFYGWMGTFLTTETEDFRNAVYSSGWPGSGDIRFMTSVLIMLMWKPLVLTAWSFSTISLDMFVAILNTAISYFFLLQTLEESK